MSEFESLLWPQAGPVQPAKKTKTTKAMRRGCDYCPANGKKGIQKIMGTVEGKKIFVWVQSPGPQENLKGVELIGPSGKWFWARMAEAGLHREDCDIQNVVRCWPADRVNGVLKMRNPTKEELFCCSLYTEQAIPKSRARVHIVLGKIAAEQLFGKKTKHRVFWSEKLNGRVVMLDHPAYFLRGYASPKKLADFKKGLALAAEYAKEKGGKFSYLLNQDYEGITTSTDAQIAVQELCEAAKKVRLSVDIEDDEVDGKRVVLCCGFSAGAGTARVFALDHPLVDISPEERVRIRAGVVQILADPDIRKVCHHGSYDATNIQAMLGCELAGYDFDTNYSEFFRFPGRRSYALAEIAAVRFPEFLGFKEVIMPEGVPKGYTYDRAYKAGQLHFAKVPWDKLVLRNGADADLTKRIEVSTKKHVSMPLLRVYMDAAFTLERMEANGPYFDYRQCELLGEIYPPRLKRQREALQMMAGDPNFNPNTPAEVAKVLYDKLGLPDDDKSRTTNHNRLESLKDQHEFPAKMIDYRTDSKIESTYRQAFKECADFYGGRLRTKWWSTGTVTGRISSGGSREGAETPTVNFQNVVGDQHVENMMVSDTGWMEIYQAWKDQSDDAWWESFLDRYVYLKFDYKQNELRFLAQSSGDEALIETFRSGKDIHVEVGHELTGWDRDKIAHDRETRVAIKGFHFGLIYGLTVKGMVAHLLREGVGPKIANEKNVQKMYDRYFKRYFRVKEFIEAMREMAKEHGYVENILGFRCPINVPIEDESDDSGRGFWANLAINAPIQGGAHQVLFICLALLQRNQEKYKLIKTPESEIHDSLWTRLKLRRLFEAMKLVKQLAEHDVIQVLRDEFKIDWQVPFQTDIAAGFRYGVTVEIGEQTTMGEFMNEWCVKNQACQRELWKEIRAAREAVS